MISARSSDESWSLAVGYAAERLRGTCSFCYGDTINFHALVSEVSALDAFLIFAPPFLAKEDMVVELPSFTCHIAGAYPIFSSELPLYQQIGLERFWNLPGWDPLDVQRRPLNG